MIFDMVVVLNESTGRDVTHVYMKMVALMLQGNKIINSSKIHH